MAVAPYDPLAQAHQREVRRFAADIQASINPATPGQIPARPLSGSTSTTGGGDGLGRREDGWGRSERYQQLAGDAFSRGGGWASFSGGRERSGARFGSAQIDAGRTPARAQVPTLDLPRQASGFARQNAAFDYAANFQEHARDWSRMLGTSRR